MKNRHNVVSDVQDVLTKHGYTFSEYIRELGRINASVLNLNENAYKEFADLYKKLEDSYCNTLEKGKLLEALVGCLFQNGYGFLFDTHRNWRTSTNEIDILLLWTEVSKKNRRAYARLFHPFY